MCRDHLHAAAPGDTGVGNRPHLALLTVQGKFVQHTRPALASLGVRVAGHAVDTPTAGKLQHIGAVLLFCIQHHLTQVLRGQAHDARPQLAILNEQPRLDVIAAAHPLVKTGALCGGSFVGSVGC